MALLFTIIFRPDLTESIFFLKKISKRRRFSKKNKNQRVATGFLTGSCRVNPPDQPGYTGFFLSLFFVQPGLVLAASRPAKPNRVLKLCFYPIFLTCCGNSLNGSKHISKDSHDIHKKKGIFACSASDIVYI